MRYALDTEFNEQNGDLISIALVREDGVEFYAEVPLTVPWKPWVEKHVKPLLTGPQISKEFLQECLALFFANDTAPIVICDWPADISHLCTLLDLGEGRRIGAKDWQFLLTGELGLQPEIPHHALSDARALMKCLKAQK